jgi:hypothetical protein
MVAAEQKHRIIILGAGFSKPAFIRQEMRRNMSPEEFAKTLEMLRETDPDRYLPKGRAPVLVQCARLDTDDNVRGCPVVYQITGVPND